MAINEVVSLRVVVTTDMSRLTTLDQRLGQAKDIKVGLDTSSADARLSAFKRELATGLKPLIDSGPLHSFNRDIEITRRNVAKLKQELSSPLKISIDRTEIDNVAPVKVPIIVDLQAYKKAIKAVESSSGLGIKGSNSNLSLSFNDSKLSSVISKGIIAAKKADDKSLVRRLLESTVKTTTSVAGGVASAPFKLAGNIIGTTSSNVLRGSAEAVGHALAAPIADSVRSTTRSLAKELDNVYKNTFTDKSLAVFIGEMMNSGSVTKATSAAVEYGDGGEILKGLERVLSSYSKRLDAIKASGTVAKDLKTLIALSTTPAKGFATKLESSSPEVAKLVLDVLNKQREEKGKESVGSLNDAKRREVFKAVKVLEAQASVNPKLFMTNLVQPALSTFGESFGTFIGTIQAYRTAMQAEASAVEQIAKGVKVAAEDASGVVQVIGGAQFAKGQGGRQVAARVESLVPGASVVPVQNPDTDNVDDSALAQGLVYKKLETIVKSLGLISGNAATDDTVLNALRQVSSALDPGFISAAAVDAVANIKIANEQGVSDEQQAITSYSLGGAELIKVARTLELLNKQVNLLAQAYPSLGFTGEDFGGMLQSVLIKGDPLNFPYDIGAASPPEYQSRLDIKGVAGLEAHADKHLYKTQEFLELFYNTFKDVSPIDLDVLKATQDGITEFQNAVGSSLYDLLTAVAQTSSYFESGDFSELAPTVGAGPITGADMAARLFESQKQLTTVQGKGTPEQQKVSATLLNRVTGLVDELKTLLKSTGVNKDASENDLKGLVKYLQQMAERNNEIQSFLGNTLSEDEASKAYFAAADVPKDERTETLKARRLDLDNAISYFKNNVDEFGVYGEKLVSTYKAIQKGMEATISGKELANDDKKELKDAYFDLSKVAEEVTSFMNSSIDLSKSPEMADVGLPKGTSIIDTVLGKEVEEVSGSLGVFSTGLEKAGDGFNSLLTILNKHLAAMASMKLERSPLTDESRQIEGLQDLSLTEGLIIAKEDVADLFFSIASGMEGVKESLAPMEPFVKLMVKLWAGAYNTASEIEGAVLPMIPGGLGQVAKSTTKNVALPLAVAGGLSMHNPEIYAALHAAIQAAGAGTAEATILVADLASKLSEAVPALKPFVHLLTDVEKLGALIQRVPVLKDIVAGGAETAGVVATGKLAQKGGQDIVKALLPQVVKEQWAVSTLPSGTKTAVDRLIADKSAANKKFGPAKESPQLEPVKPKIKLSSSDYDDMKKTISAGTSRIRELLSHADKAMEDGAIDYARTLLDEAQRIQSRQQLSSLTDRFVVPDNRKRSAATFAKNEEAQIARMDKLRSKLEEQGAQALPELNMGESGRNVIKGLIAGADEAGDEFASKMAELYEKGEDGFDAAAGIQSPSKRMMERGKYLTLGAALGAVSAKGELERALEETFEGAMGGIDLRGSASKSPVWESTTPISEDLSTAANTIKRLVASISGLNSTELDDVPIMSTNLGKSSTRGMYSRRTDEAHLNTPRMVAAKYGIDTESLLGTIAHELRHAAQQHSEAAGLMMRYLKPSKEDAPFVAMGVEASVSHHKGAPKEVIEKAVKKEEDAYTFELNFIRQFQGLANALATGKDDQQGTELITKMVKALGDAESGKLKPADFGQVNIKLLRELSSLSSVSGRLVDDFMAMLEVINSHHPDAATGNALTSSAVYQVDASLKSSGGSLADGAVDGVMGSAGEFYAAMASLAEGGLDAFDSAAGIQSPSKKTKKAGEFIAEGAIRGVVNKSPEFYAAMAEFFKVPDMKALTSELGEGLSSLIGQVSENQSFEGFEAINAAVVELRELSEVFEEFGDTESIENINSALEKVTAQYRLLRRESDYAFDDELTPARQTTRGGIARIRGAKIASNIGVDVEDGAALGADVAAAIEGGAEEASILSQELLTAKDSFMKLLDVASAFGGPVVGQLIQSGGALIERFGILRKVGAGVFLGISAGVAAYTFSQIGLAQEIKSLSLQFQSLGYDGEASLGKMMRLSQDTGSSFRQTAKLGSQIAGALQFTGLENQIGSITEKIVKVNTALQLGADESQRFETALVQMLSKGVVSMEEVRQQAAEAVPSFFPALARGLNMTPGQAMAAISSGEVSSAEAVPAALEELEKMSAGAYEEGLRSLPASLNRLSNSMTKTNAAFGKFPLEIVSGIAYHFANIVEAAAPITAALAPVAAIMVALGGIQALILVSGLGVVQTALKAASSAMTLFATQSIATGNAAIAGMTSIVSSITGLQGAAAGLATGGLIVGLLAAAVAIGGIIHHLKKYNKEYKDLIDLINSRGIEEKPLDVFTQSTYKPTSSNPVSAALDVIPQGINDIRINNAEKNLQNLIKRRDELQATGKSKYFLWFELDNAKELNRAIEKSTKNLKKMKAEGGPLSTHGKNEDIDKTYGEEATALRDKVDAIAGEVFSMDTSSLIEYGKELDGLNGKAANLQAAIALEGAATSPDKGKIEKLSEELDNAKKAAQEFDTGLTSGGGLQNLIAISEQIKKLKKEAEGKGQTSTANFLGNLLIQTEKSIERLQKFIDKNPLKVKLTAAEGAFQDARNVLEAQFSDARVSLLKQREDFLLTEQELAKKEAEVEKANASEKLIILNDYITEQSNILKKSRGAQAIADTLEISKTDFASTGFESASLEKLNALIASIESGDPAAEKYRGALEAVKNLKSSLQELVGARLEDAEASNRAAQANLTYMNSLRDVMGVLLRVNAAKESARFGLENYQVQQRTALKQQRNSGELSDREFEKQSALLSIDQLSQKMNVNSRVISILTKAINALTSEERAMARKLIGTDIENASFGQLQDFLARKEQADAQGLPYGNSNIRDAAQAAIQQQEIGAENLQLEEQKMEAARGQLVEVTASQLRQYRQSIRNFNNSITDYIQGMNDQLEDTQYEIQQLNAQTELLRAKNDLRSHLMGAVQSIDREFFQLISDAVSGITDIVNEGELRQTTRQIRDLTKQHKRTIQSTMDDAASLMEQRYELAGAKVPGTTIIGDSLWDDDESRLAKVDELLGEGPAVKGFSSNIENITSKISGAASNIGLSLEDSASLIKGSQQAALQKLMQMGASYDQVWKSSDEGLGIYNAPAKKLAEQEGLAALRDEYNSINAQKDKSDADIVRAASIFASFDKDGQEAGINKFNQATGYLLEFGKVYGADGEISEKVGGMISDETEALTADMDAAFNQTIAALRDKSTALANLNREKIEEILINTQEGFETLTRKLPGISLQISSQMRQITNSIADLSEQFIAALSPGQVAVQRRRQLTDQYEGIRESIVNARAGFADAGALFSGEANDETLNKLDALVEVMASQGNSEAEKALAQESSSLLSEMINSFRNNGDRLEIQNKLQASMVELTQKEIDATLANSQAMQNLAELTRQEKNAARAGVAQTFGSAITDTAQALPIAQVDKDYVAASVQYNVALASQAREMDEFKNQLKEAGIYSDELYASFEELSDIRLDKLKSEMQVLRENLRETLKGGISTGLNSILDDFLETGKINFGQIAVEFGKTIIKGIAQPGIDTLSSGISNFLTTGKWNGVGGGPDSLEKPLSQLEQFAETGNVQRMNVQAAVVNLDGPLDSGASLLSGATGDTAIPTIAPEEDSLAQKTGAAIKSVKASSDEMVSSLQSLPAIIAENSKLAFSSTSPPKFFEGAVTSGGTFGTGSDVPGSFLSNPFGEGETITTGLATSLTESGVAIQENVHSFAQTSGDSFKKGAFSIAGAVAAIPSIINSFKEGDVGGGLLGILSAALPIIGMFSEGGSVGDLLGKERAASGRDPMLAVVHKGEQVLTTKNNDAQIYRHLKKTGAWDMIKQGGRAYAYGGNVGKVNDAGANLFGSSRSHAYASSSVSSANIYVQGVSNTKEFGRNQTQIANRQASRQKRASKRQTNA